MPPEDKKVKICGLWFLHDRLSNISKTFLVHHLMSEAWFVYTSKLN